MGNTDGSGIAGNWQQAMINGIVSQAEEYCLIVVKFRRIDLVEAQETGHQQNKVDFPGVSESKVQETYP